MKKVLYPELRAQIARCGEMQKDIAALLSVGKSTVHRKMEGQSEWNLSEINILCKHYGKPFEFLFSKYAI